MGQLTPARQQRARKRVAWKKPAGKRRPDCIDATIAIMARSIEQRRGAFWDFIAMKPAVYGAGGGTPDARRARPQGYRQRAFRSDGAASFQAMLSAMLYGCDILSGFIGKPRPNGGPWARYRVEDLCHFAFGPLVPEEVSQRRGERAMHVAASLGFLKLPKQQRIYHEAEDRFSSDAAVRHLNLEALCRICGTLWMLHRDRKHATTKRATAGRSSAAQQPGQGALGLQTAHDLSEPQKGHQRPPVRPDSTASPPRSGSTTAAAALAEIAELLKDSH